MAIPANLDTVTVTGSYITADGTPASGTVSFTPTVWLRDDTGDVVVPQLPVVATLNASGEFTEVLIATDDTNVDQNWAYVVTETINGATQSKTVLLPATSPTVDMAELEPVIDPTQYSDIRGPRGYSVLNGTGAPSAGLGEDGDFYLDTTAKAIYGPRTAGAWGAGTSLIGPQGPAGATGSTGATGPAGPANSLSIGTVTTGAAGSSASSTITGTAPNQTLNLTIPRGDTGATGATGPQGPQGDPGPQGPQGVAGPTGPTGATGPQGDAATISVGSVTTGAPGSSASVTNVGTTSAAVFNFTIPKGDTGDLGTLSGTAPITYSSNNIGIQVGTGLTVNAGSLVPDFGTTSGKVAQGNDSRFTDARTPTAHKASHATGGTDALSPADIGAIGTSALTSTNPAALGAAAAPGTSTDVARLDHVHARPTPADIGAVANALLNAKASIITATAASTPAALSVGANDTVLTADSSTATGLKWAAVSGLPSQTGNANRLLTTNGTSASWTGVITNLVNLAPEERFNVVASAATGTININFLTAGVWYYTTNASANHTINFRGDASNTLNSLLATGDAITVGWVINNGTTAYYPTTIQIDGSSVTPRWLNNSAPPSSSQANQTAGIDAFTFTIIKTAATPTYTVLGSWAQYR